MRESEPHLLFTIESGPSDPETEQSRPCRCNWQGHSNHDRLVELFRLDTPERAAAAVVEAVRYYEGDHDGEVSWMDWPDFIAEHNWPDPVSTRHAAVAMRDMVRSAAAHQLNIEANRPSISVR